jgi:hypothetical protein
MSEQLADWPRPHFAHPGGRPFVFYVVNGEFSALPGLSRDAYRSKGVYPGLELSRYNRQKHPDVVAAFQDGYLWDRLFEQNAALADQIRRSNECLILRGELDDLRDLNYLRDSVGLLTYLLDNGDVCVYDPQMFFWWERDVWRQRIFEPAASVPSHHALILTSDENHSAKAEALPMLWFHTRGMRMFGRPDLSVHNVPPLYHNAVIEMLNRFIILQAHGGVISPSHEIRMQELPSGMKCRHAGNLDDPDFNNAHVEISLPT